MFSFQFSVFSVQISYNFKLKTENRKLKTDYLFLAINSNVGASVG